MGYDWFLPQRGQVVKKCFLTKALFAISPPFYASLKMQFSQSSDHVEWFLIPFYKTSNYKEKSFQKWFWIFSHVFGIGHKMHLKKQFLTVFASFFICNFLSHLLM